MHEHLLLLGAEGTSCIIMKTKSFVVGVGVRQTVVKLKDEYTFFYIN